MYVVAVSVRVRPEHADEFIEATLDNARNTRREPGNLRFDVLRSLEAPAEFLLYEVYRDEPAFKRHHQTPHYLRWREAVADWMAQPRAAVKYASLFPDGDGW